MENKKKVFFIEDDPAIIDIYTTAFKSAKINLEVISSGQEAINRIKKGEDGMPSLVLLDLILPDINGREVLKEIKSNNATKGITVFIMSNDTASDLKEAGAIKPDKFILKANTTPTQLIDLVKKELE